jgi:hypothetical protein
MEIEFTFHAADMMEKRDISEEQILDTIIHPDAKEPGRGGTHSFFKVMRFAEGRLVRKGRVLRVVVNRNVKPWRIVSLYPDRRVRL